MWRWRWRWRRPHLRVERDELLLRDHLERVDLQREGKDVRQRRDVMAEAEVEVLPGRHLARLRVSRHHDAPEAALPQRPRLMQPLERRLRPHHAARSVAHLERRREPSRLLPHHRPSAAVLVRVGRISVRRELAVDRVGQKLDEGGAVDAEARRRRHRRHRRAPRLLGQ